MKVWNPTLRVLHKTIRQRSLSTSTLYYQKKEDCHQSQAATTYIEHLSSLKILLPTHKRIKHTGIICTIGPASREVNMLVTLIENGMDIARLNFSHGTHDYHLETIHNIRKAVAVLSERKKRIVNIAIALDTKGPEIRTGVLEAEGDVILKRGENVTLTTNEKFKTSVNKSIIYVDYKNLVKLTSTGSLIYIDDGSLTLKVLKIEGENVLCEIEHGGLLGSRKGVNLPGVDIDLPSMSAKDIEDISFGVKNGLDIIFASFIRDRQGIEDIRKLTNVHQGDQDIKNTSIIAKIENRQGIQNLDDIIKAADGIMVARGDLGIEIPVEKVFLAQKNMIAKCNLAGKPVICATQMLESMTNHPRPTRAETSDVANAILDGADCIMLSGETAKGKFPVQCVQVMSRICQEAEAVVPYRQLFMDIQKKILPPVPVNQSIAIAARAAAEQSSATAILVITTSGLSAGMISRFRPSSIIIAITTHPEVARKMNLYRGVIPCLHEKTKLPDWSQDIEERIKTGLHVGVERNIINEGDKVVLVTGWRKGRGATNIIKILVFDKTMLGSNAFSS